MTRYRQQDLILHLFLFSVLSIGLLMMYLYKGYPLPQQGIMVLMATFYALWGIVYHKIKGDAHPRLVIEYVLFAILALVLIRSAYIH